MTPHIVDVQVTKNRLVKTAGLVSSHLEVRGLS